MFGLMGVDSKGCMYTPSGKKLFRLPVNVAFFIQNVQHWIARKTWK
jgi:hypothetical protein